MATRDEILREKTCKEVEEVPQRIFYVLTEEKMEIHRISKMIGHLTATLKDRGILTDQDIDDLLFETVM